MEILSISPSTPAVEEEHSSPEQERLAVLLTSSQYREAVTLCKLEVRAVSLQHPLPWKLSTGSVARGWTVCQAAQKAPGFTLMFYPSGFLWSWMVPSQQSMVTTKTEASVWIIYNYLVSPANIPSLDNGLRFIEPKWQNQLLMILTNFVYLN